MYFVYVIKSKTNNYYYVGFTKNTGQRLNAHNKGYVRSTRSRKPYKLFFVQLTKNRIIARDLEKYLKIRYNKECLVNLVNS